MIVLLDKTNKNIVGEGKRFYSPQDNYEYYYIHLYRKLGKDTDFLMWTRDKLEQYYILVETEDKKLLEALYGRLKPAKQKG